LSVGDEKARVDQLAQLLAASPGSWFAEDLAARVTVGASDGDDAAVVEVSGASSIVVASDYVRGVKFALYEAGLLSYYDLGWYLAAANLSDIAAMGAIPIGLLTVVRYDASMDDEAFLDVMRGAKDAAAQVGAAVLGGDSGGAERLILSAAAIGFASPGSCLTRGAARPGDLICLTGSVGAPAAAIVHFVRREPAPTTDDVVEDLLRAWRRPIPRVAEGRVLAACGGRVACQDVSDGLRSTLVELARVSGVRFVVDRDAIPIDPAVSAVADLYDLDALALATSASVDFELLFTLPADRLATIRQAFDAGGHQLHVIGVVEEGGGAVMKTNDGAVVPFPGVEWRHQTEDVAAMLSDGSRFRTA
jgi:thiamine-monophosphate kinase